MTSRWRKRYAYSASAAEEPEDRAGGADGRLAPAASRRTISADPAEAGDEVQENELDAAEQRSRRSSPTTYSAHMLNSRWMMLPCRNMTLTRRQYSWFDDDVVGHQRAESMELHGSPPPIGCTAPVTSSTRNIDDVDDDEHAW